MKIRTLESSGGGSSSTGSVKVKPRARCAAMERVLKRVGLSRRLLAPSAPSLSAEEEAEAPPSQNQRRRRRSKSRRRSTTASSSNTRDANVDNVLDGSTPPAGGVSSTLRSSVTPGASTIVRKKPAKSRRLFSFDWDSVRDCRSCKSRALLSKRFCSRKCDNELYRSNSFKFERFVRGDGDNDGVSTLGEKIALCDDYSVPLDDVNRRRPNSIAAPSASDWNISSPNEDKVEVLETYSTPRDFKQRLSQPEEAEWEREFATASAAAAAAPAEYRTVVDAEQKCFTSPDREYSQPYTTDASSDPSSDEVFFGHRVEPPQIELNSPDSISEAVAVPLEATEVKIEAKRHPSPYYYSDLLKPRVVEQEVNPTTSRQQQQQLLHSETLFSTKSECHPRNRYEFEKQLLFQTSAGFKEKQKGKDKRKDKDPNKDTKKKLWIGYHKKYRKTSESFSEKRHSKHTQRAQQLALALLNDVHEAVGTSTSSGADRLSYHHLDCGEDDVDDVEMTRQRHLYETAFDSRVAKSDDDLDDIDKVTNHSVLSHIDSDRRQSTIGTSRSTSRCRSAFQTDQSTVTNLSTKLEKMHIPDGVRIPLRGYTPSPPSTAPLPTKFHGKELVMNSIRSAPNLPSHSKTRLKHLNLSIKSLRQDNGSSAFDITKVEEVRPEKDQRVLEIKDRPRKDLLLFKRTKDSKGGTILEFKNRRRRHKYSSTESMTTSSSGGSMESIKSSTSEGNRSTTSTDSRNSSSLSSHDSDSGAASNYLAAHGSFQSNKLHILSPISDKSSQEPVSEISDNNRNNNSQKCSPEETNDMTKSRRRLPQNKNLLNLGHRADPEIQGSDSGISIQSRTEKNRFNLGELSSSCGQNNDLSDLPFDMPKLRRRRLAAQEAATSSSATSIDFGDLPFDMPKLRRRLRVQQIPKELSMSQASSSQSVIDPDGLSMSLRPKLSLNLDGNSVKQKPGLGLSLSIGFNSMKSPTKTQDLIDINLPLEKQGWYHGAITRIEAENVLRALREGSFLVRNSESTKQDYSLSLKSARGFMHMRIQRDESNGTRSFILGQFSKPFTSIPEMIKHFSLNGLPIRGAEHMCLVQPVIVQLL